MSTNLKSYNSTLRSTNNILEATVWFVFTIGLLFFWFSFTPTFLFVLKRMLFNLFQLFIYLKKKDFYLRYWYWTPASLSITSVQFALIFPSYLIALCFIWRLRVYAVAIVLIMCSSKIKDIHRLLLILAQLSSCRWIWRENCCNKSLAFCLTVSHDWTIALPPSRFPAFFIFWSKQFQASSKTIDFIGFDLSLKKTFDWSMLCVCWCVIGFLFRVCKLIYEWMRAILSNLFRWNGTTRSSLCSTLISFNATYDFCVKFRIWNVCEKKRNRNVQVKWCKYKNGQEKLRRKWIDDDLFYHMKIGICDWGGW